MTNIAKVMRIVAFEKCEHCSDCVFFYVNMLPSNLPGVLMITSRKAGFHFITEMLAGGSLSPDEFNMFGLELANSGLPEDMLEAKKVHQLTVVHTHDPKVMRGIGQMVDLLNQKPDGKPGN